MSKLVPLFPYAVSQALTLRLGDFDDPTRGEPLPVEEVTASGSEDEPAVGHVYDVGSMGEPWTKISFRLSAELSPDELATILPVTSDIAKDTALLVLITCPATKFRHGVRLRMVREGLWTGHASLQRADLRSEVTLQPRLVRTTTIASEEELPYAKRAGTVIADGVAATLLLERQDRSLQSTVAVFWEDFGNSSNPWRREHVEDVYHLEMFGDPRLHLNSRYSQLREIMESTAKSGPEAAIRDLSAALVAQPVLLQLATAAVASLERDEDSGAVDLPPGWKGVVLRSLLPRLYPDEPDDALRLQRAAVDARDSEGALNFASRLGSAVQETIGSYKTVEAAIRAYESMRSKEELIDA